jgi:hypothetical protein
LSYRLNLSRVYFNDPNPGGNQLPPQRISKGPYRGLCSAIDTATSIRLSRSNTANIDDVTSSSLIPLLKNGEDGLRHVYKSGDVRCEHDINIFFNNLGGSRKTSHKTARAKIWISPAKL